MSNAIRSFWFAVKGPTIYRVPVGDATLTESVNYRPNLLEHIPTVIINTTDGIYTLLKWTVLLWSPWLLFNAQNRRHLWGCVCLTGYVSAVYGAAFLIRGAGRLLNSNYCHFLNLYRLALHDKANEQALERLTLYSFSSPWPAQFDVRQLPEAVCIQKKPTPSRSADLPTIFWPLTWMIAHTVGIRLAYPGCLGIMNSLTLPARLEARDELRRRYSIRRIGLRTRDGEFVEAFYADRRGCTSASSASSSSAGHGKATKYGHKGLPFPDKVQNSIEAVLLFAVHQLHFSLDQIYLFGWSIGGYTASWAAMNYPEIGGLILDATFDDLDELAKNVVPELFYPLVLGAMRNHLDLNNLAQVKAYDGPIRFIRRGEDEVISTSVPPSRASNRGNVLFVGLLKHRFPYLMTSENESLLMHYLSLDAEERRNFLNEMNCSAERYGPMVSEYLRQEALKKQTVADSARTPPVTHPTVGLFPSTLGREISDVSVKWSMLLYLVFQYFDESPGAHCAPLQRACFQLPWLLCAESSLRQSASPQPVNDGLSVE
ncbi:hypothetical protein EG68_01755 [Paragonimus skrjabini miyazakii]|uniref:Abhydrolase domain-containing protein 16A n=1 Tax=Paragonimus skrjabini miyazakii TaxID=59628 RepID=A0A8S9Z6G1_9TREM|nr:hypothetical protein EG68_01755 [Paragonimus skrjabini miyazakii]